MDRSELNRIRALNAKKKHGHKDSAVEHCAHLITEVDRLRSALERIAEWGEIEPKENGMLTATRIAKEALNAK